MEILKRLFNICVTLPNMSLFIFYFIFILLVPLLLMYTRNLELLQNFLILLVPIAVVLTEAGKPEIFKNLYPIEYVDLTGYISKLLISFISLCAIIYSSVNLGYQLNNTIFGVIIGVISVIVIFLFCREMIPEIIKRGDKYMKENLETKVYKHNWNKYIIGISSILIFLILEIILGEIVINLL